MAVAQVRGKLISSSSSSCGFSYHVFLSFRGKDTRKKFADHLYSALVEAGLDTFRDDDEIERGEGIEEGIRSAMRDSRVAVVVLSKDYASSTWCLDELEMMLARRRNAGLILIPVFYEVDPSQVRAQLGSYAEAFTNHSKRFENEMNVVEAWRAALREVSAIGGMVFQDGYEAQFVKDVVEKVCKAAVNPPLYVCRNLVSIETRTRDINSWLQESSHCTGIAMIFGLGGVGKTTVAKTVYNQNFNNFERISFISSVREVGAQSSGLLRLQRQLLLDIHKGKTAKPRSIDEGIMKIRDVICRKRVLIVLDDVQHAEELQAFIGMEGPPKSESKIIVTTRNEGLLKAHIPCLKMKVEPLDNVASLKLFSWHAFGQDHPSNDSIKLCQTAIRHCGGLPLALEVLGSCLSRLSIHQWETALREPVEIDDGKIRKVLKISFDSLQDDRDKNLLLDVACFFVGMDRDYVERVLEGSDLYRVLGLQKLTERCLIATDENNKLVMHQLIRDIARDLVSQESDIPGERTRVWLHKDAIRILRRNSGTKKVRSFVLDNEQTNAGSTEKMELRIEALAKMRNLKLLNLNNAVLKGECRGFPTSLVWLSWHGFPLNLIPNKFSFDDLVVLDMSGSKLQVFGDRFQFQCLPSLKILNLSHSYFLVSIPNFSVIPSLERLILENCSSLAEIDESIGILDKLICLDLKNCRSLVMLPGAICRLESLQKLVLSGCSGLNRGRWAQPNSTNSSITSMTRQSFQSANKRPRTSWSLFTFLPRFLVHLSLTNCNLSDYDIPEDLSQLRTLQELDLGNNPISTLPESIQSLTSLDSLSLYQCKRLQYLPELPDSLTYVNVSGCTSLERIRSLKSFASVKCLILYGCQNLVEIGGIFELHTLKTVNQEMINRLRLFDLTSYGGSEENMVSHISGNQRKTPFQVLSECGILSIYLLGSDIPSWYSFRNEKRSALSFNVPCGQGHPIVGINLCIAYAARSADGDLKSNFEGSSLPFITIENETKGLTWTYFPTCYVIEEVDSKLWLSHWSVRDGFAGDDHVYVRVGAQCGIEVNKIGVCLIYEAEEGSQSISSATGTDFGGTVMNCEGPPFVVDNQFRYCPLLRFSLRPRQS